MVTDAESHADEAHRLRELADARNAGEQLAYQTERTLAEHRDKLDEADALDDRGADHGAPAGARGDGRRRDPGEDRGARGGVAPLADAIYAQARPRRPVAAVGQRRRAADDEVVEDADYEVIDEEEAAKTS